MTSTAKQQAKKVWFGNSSVAGRINWLIILPLLGLLGIGAFSLYALNKNNAALEHNYNRIQSIASTNTILHTIDLDYIQTLYQVSLGIISWEDGLTKLTEARRILQNEVLPIYVELNQQSDSQESNRALETIEATQNLLQITDTGVDLLQSKDRAALELYIINDLTDEVSTPSETILENEKLDVITAQNFATQAIETSTNFVITTAILTGLIIILLLLLGYLIYRSFSDAFKHLLEVVLRLEEGDYSARVNLAGSNEFAKLGQNFDRMLDDRLATQIQIDHEHKQLNNSVFALLEAVAYLSDKNLTVRAKITEDATGPLADAINQLAEDTGDVLKQVREIATSVDTASTEVNRHAQSVNSLIHTEHADAQQSKQDLTAVLQHLENIARSSKQADEVASHTAQATRQARESVSQTMEKVSHIRDSVRETSKRLKRLGERSQEISNITSIISNISERTTVLALNASMQASAAGDAGRGFSVIAEEIQRLAENSKDSTEQITTLVDSIQQEANTTIITMDQAVESVVSGSEIAEDADRKMQTTLVATNQLVKSVAQIAHASAKQADISQTVQARAEQILNSTETTSREMRSLTELTQNLTDFSRQLVTSVKVFKLEK